MRAVEYIGRYRILRVLGEGGMATVYEGLDERLGLRVAVKVLHPELLAQPELRERFFAEGQVANRVAHPALVPVHEAGVLPDGRGYLAMELLRGKTLSQYLGHGKHRQALSVAFAVRIARQVAAAMTAAHEGGVIHRDLKPDNLFLSEDPELPGGLRVRVLDFGIAKLHKPQRSATLPGIGLGTPGYLAPEQITFASEVDEKADVYSLGVLLFEMLTRTRPFARERPEQELCAQLTEQPLSWGAAAVTCPPELRSLTLRMLAREPAHRPDMAEVHRALKRLATATFEYSCAYGAPLPPSRSGQGRWPLFAAALIFFCGVHALSELLPRLSHVQLRSSPMPLPLALVKSK